MMLMENDHEGVLSLEEAKAVFNRLYDKVNGVTKIQLKCWLYYCESRDRGGKKAMTFDVYKEKVRMSELIQMIRGYLIDVSDLGGVDEAVSIISKYHMKHF